jgi:hypothetical protein
MAGSAIMSTVLSAVPDVSIYPTTTIIQLIHKLETSSGATTLLKHTHYRKQSTILMTQPGSSGNTPPRIMCQHSPHGARSTHLSQEDKHDHDSPRKQTAACQVYTYLSIVSMIHSIYSKKIITITPMTNSPRTQPAPSSGWSPTRRCCRRGSPRRTQWGTPRTPEGAQGHQKVVTCTTYLVRYLTRYSDTFW